MRQPPLVDTQGNAVKITGIRPQNVYDPQNGWMKVGLITFALREQQFNAALGAGVMATLGEAREEDRAVKNMEISRKHGERVGIESYQVEAVKAGATVAVHSTSHIDTFGGYMSFALLADVILAFRNTISGIVFRKIVDSRGSGNQALYKLEIRIKPDPKLIPDGVKLPEVEPSGIDTDEFLTALEARRHEIGNRKVGVYVRNNQDVQGGPNWINLVIHMNAAPESEDFKYLTIGDSYLSRQRQSEYLWFWIVRASLDYVTAKANPPAHRADGAREGRGGDIPAKPQ